MSVLMDTSIRAGAVFAKVPAMGFSYPAELYAAPGTLYYPNFVGKLVVSIDKTN
jgi:hypothetical protein